LAGSPLLDMPPDGGIFGPKLTSGQVLLQCIGSLQILYKFVDGFSLWSGNIHSEWWWPALKPELAEWLKG